MPCRFLLIPIIAALALIGRVEATLIVNPAQPLTKRVTVQVIDTAATNGTNAAPVFGNAAQQNAITAGISGIWAQAGIEMQFKFRLGTWNNSFALLGTTGNNNPRPDEDLDTIVTNAGNAGLLDPDPTVINLFMVRIVPGFSQTSNNTSNGLAFLDDNGIAMWAGPSLVSFTDGQDVIASVLAHEIGHNLGLDHIVASENLMQSGGAGERLNAAQIAIARDSFFAVTIPEPSEMVLVMIGLSVFAGARLRAANRISHQGGATASSPCLAS